MFFDFWNIEKTDNEGNTRLMIACQEGKLKKVKSLINKGANVNAKNKYGDTVLVLAMRYCPEIVPELLKVPGLEVNTRTRHGLTPLMIAVRNEHPEIVPELLKVPGIDVNAKDRFGETALMFAVKYHPEIVSELLKVPGIDVDAKDKGGWKAWEKAREEGHTQIAQRLRSWDSSQQVVNPVGSDENETTKALVQEVGKNLTEDEQQALKKMIQSEKFLHSEIGTEWRRRIYQKLPYDQSLKVYVYFQDTLEFEEKQPDRDIIRGKRQRKPVSLQKAEQER